MAILQMAAAADSKSVQVALLVGQSFGGSSVPVQIAVDGVGSDPYSIVVN